MRLHRDGRMKTLTDIFLEKSFKYIRKFWKNGRWNYVYEEPNGRVSYNRPVYRQFVGKASAAIKHPVCSEARSGS